MQPRLCPQDTRHRIYQPIEIGGTARQPAAVTEIQTAHPNKLYESLLRQRWALLGTGLTGALLLTLLQVEVIPGILPRESGLAAVGVSAGAAFLAAAGVGSWLLWTRIARTRTKLVTVTADGLEVRFFGGERVSLPWTSPSLHLKIRTFPGSGASAGAVLEWANGRMGEYAAISLDGSEVIRGQAAGLGLRITTSVTGKPPYQQATTEITRAA